ncbi:MAG: TRAP transporter large permease [Pseudomonadota bacterium]
MTATLIGLVGLACLFALLLLRMPVALAMLTVGVGGNYALSIAEPYLRFGPYLAQFKSLLWGTVSSYELSVVPLFILMGCVAGQAGLSRDLFRGLNALVGHVRGGVAMAAIGACAGFGAVSGSSLATASTMGRVALPSLAALRYAPRFATGTLAAGGTLGILIPPSVALVIYAIIVEASIIQMFQAAALPGLLAIIFFILTIAVMVRLRPQDAPLTDPLDPLEKRQAIMRLLPVLGLFLGIILGLGLGLFTPTPAAAIGAFAVILYGFALTVITGDGLSWAGLKKALLDSAVTSGMIYFILFGAEVLKTFFARAGLPQLLADWAAISGFEPLAILLLMLALLILLGCFMDSLSMILVVVPFFWPVLVLLNGGDMVSAQDAAFGMDSESLKLWFGILALVVVELGLITPPVGLNVFIIAQLSPETPMGDIFRGVLPFFLAELVRIALLVGLPFLALGLPGLLR